MQQYQMDPSTGKLQMEMFWHHLAIGSFCQCKMNSVTVGEADHPYICIPESAGKEEWKGW